MANWQNELPELAEEWPQEEIPQTPEAAYYNSLRSQKLADTLTERPEIAQGTFVVKESGQNQQGNANLQQAAAAFKSTPTKSKQGGRDIFTPLKLQTMFQAPKESVNNKESPMRPPSPKLPTPPHVDSPNSYINSQDFTFSCPRPRNSWKKIPHFLGQSNKRNLSAAVEQEFSQLENTPRHSTPTRSLVQEARLSPIGDRSDKENLNPATPASEARPLKLFHFDYDTFTRDHLEKLVDEIDGLTLSQQQQEQEQSSRTHSNSFGEEDQQWMAYDRSDDDSTKPIPRAAKRIRLSPEVEARHEFNIPRSAVRERIRKRRATDYARSATQQENIPRIAFSMPADAIQLASQFSQSASQYSQKSQRMSSSSLEAGTVPTTSLRSSNPITSRLAKAQALMDRIRLNAPDRSTSTSVDDQNSSSESAQSMDEVAQESEENRGLDTVAEVTEEDYEVDAPRPVEERRHPSSAKTATFPLQRMPLSSDGGSANTVIHISQRPQLPVNWQSTVKSTTPTSPEPSPQSKPQGTAAELHLRRSLEGERQTAPMPQRMPSGSLPGARYFATAPTSSSFIFGNSTQSRQVSGASSIQQASPPRQEEPPKSVSRAGLLNIRPEAVKELLQESSGKMVYDEVHQRWVKMPKQRLSIPVENLRASQVRSAESQLDEGHSSEDDPFGEIESFVQSEQPAGLPSHTPDVPEEFAEEDNPESFTLDSTVDLDQAPLAMYAAQSAVHNSRQSQKNSIEAHFATLNDRDVNIAASTPHPSRVDDGPRSVLKHRQYDDLLEVSGKDRRSVSFSDMVNIPTGNEFDQTLPDAFVPEGVNTKRSGLRYELQPIHDAEEDTTVEETPSKNLGDPETRSWPDLLLQTDLQADSRVENSVATTADSQVAKTRQQPTHIRAKSKSQGKSRNPLQDSVKSLANATFLTECSFAVSHNRLVEVITDVEPFEPCWEDLRTINLANKNMESLVRLNEFLPMLDEADLSDNRITYLTGVPGSMRTLLLKNNRLTSLTSFGHLRYLVRLDLSHNQLDTLHQLSCLVHLRDFKADYNEITSVAGLSDIDGLLRLSLRNNALAAIDFSSTRWRNLEMVDLAHNSLSEIQALESLTSCVSLNLEHNKLSECNANARVDKLRILRLGHNPLSDFDAAPFSHLRTLFIDSANLGTLRNLDRLPKLESFSIRDQSGSKLQLPTQALRDIRRLYLSGNTLPSSFRTNHYFNLTYVELALCQISSLPPNFAELLPNCRFLNLSYNFLDDITALTGLTRLKHLSIVGSRISLCREIVTTLASMPELELVDLRLNPLTLSFYPPLPHTSNSHTDYRIIHTEQTDNQPSWEDVDLRYRRNMPDLWYLRRIAYRNVLLQSCPRLKMIDGLRSETKSARRQISELLIKAQSTEHGKVLMVQ